MHIESSANSSFKYLLTLPEETQNKISEIANSLWAFPYIGFEGDQNKPIVVLKLTKPYEVSEKTNKLAPQVIIFPDESKISFDRVVPKGSFDLNNVTHIEIHKDGIQVFGQNEMGIVSATLNCDGDFSSEVLFSQKEAA